MRTNILGITDRYCCCIAKYLSDHRERRGCRKREVELYVQSMGVKTLENIQSKPGRALLEQRLRAQPHNKEYSRQYDLTINWWSCSCAPELCYWFSSLGLALEVYQWDTNKRLQLFSIISARKTIIIPHYILTTLLILDSFCMGHHRKAASCRCWVCEARFLASSSPWR